MFLTLFGPFPYVVLVIYSWTFQSKISSGGNCPMIFGGIIEIRYRKTSKYLQLTIINDNTVSWVDIFWITVWSKLSICWSWPRFLVSVPLLYYTLQTTLINKKSNLCSDNQVNDTHLHDLKIMINHNQYKGILLTRTDRGSLIETLFNLKYSIYFSWFAFRKLLSKCVLVNI